MRIEVTSKEFVGRIVTITIDLPEGTDVKVLGKSVALDPGDAVPAETKEISLERIEGSVRKLQKMGLVKIEEVKCPYHWKKQASKYAKWMKLKKVLGHAPSKEEMKVDHRGKHVEHEVPVSEEKDPPEEKSAKDDPDQPMTDEMRYHQYLVKMKGEMPLCDECLDPIRKPSDAKHAGGLFFHIKCWEDR